jgi:acyl carrier protein
MSGMGSTGAEPVRRVGVDEAEALTRSYEDLWRQLPGSNMAKQETLLGRGPGAGSDAVGEPESWVGRTGPSPMTADGADGEAHTLALGALHLVLQWYLDDDESVVGCCLVGSGVEPGARLLPSYVYAEAEDEIETVLADVAEQLRSDQSVEVPAHAPAYRGDRRAPAFFYLAGEGDGGLGGWSPEALETSFPGRGVVLTAVENADHATIGVWMRPDAAEAIDLEEMYERYETALGCLAAGEVTRVGEVRERLGGGGTESLRELDAMETRVAALWAEVLGIDPAVLEPGSSYFELGGTSLNAFKLVNRVRTVLHRDISIRDIVANPTVRDMARLVA